MNKKELWLRLCNYHFDNLVPPDLWTSVTSKFSGTNASAKAFAHKLAVKHKWKQSFALKAVSEYKKFIYLGVVSDFVVTPSEIIDKVWHQHILFSKAYRHFCNEVIEYEFDHTPELIPLLTQTGIYNAQYLDTIALYKKEFDREPPAEVWGTPKFDENVVPANGRSKKKEAVNSDGSGGYSDSFPLYMNFESGNTDPGFEGYGGGDFGGAGAGGDWSDGGSSDSNSDGGSSCSSCSSGCGGGD